MKRYDLLLALGVSSGRGGSVDLLDLQKLSDFDFESLCKDLFERILGVRLEIFTSGPDGGIDLRYIGPGGEKVIIQCKHWMKSGRSKLFKHLIEKELVKVRRLSPTRYILATSVEMTPAAKAKLTAEFQPHIMNEGDIFGIDEITSTLRDHPDIIRKHIRLWLNDATILEAAISRNIIRRSLHLADDVKDTLRTYVPSKNLRQAMQFVEKNHVVLLSGPPGVGKTTLAQVICARYASKGFELVEVSENVEDIYRVWDDKSPQLFIYDDFLGQSSLGNKLYKNEDGRLLSVMRRVRREPNKRLVCTTRGYILEQARQRYERLDRENLDPLTFLVDLGAFTLEEKAQILYNHVHWSDWPSFVKEDFAQPETYRPIIRHRNFNPRALSNVFSVPYNPDRGTPKSQLMNILDDPMVLWRHIFDHQLGDSERKILVLLFSMGSESSAASLEQAFLECRAGSVANFRSGLKVLEGTFVKVVAMPYRRQVEFANPSVNDFMLAKLANEPDLVQWVLSNPYSFDQVVHLWDAHTGPCDVEAPVKVNLMPHAADLERAALATLDRRETASYDRAGRLVVCLRIAQDLALSDLAQQVADRLSIQGCVYDARNLDDIQHLIRLTHESRHARVRALHESVKLEGLTALFNRDRQESGLFTAAMYALQLSEFVDAFVKEEILEAADEKFKVVLDRHLFHSDGLDSYLLGCGLDYVRQYGDWQERWPMASDLMTFPDLESADGEFEDSEEAFDVDPEYIDGEAYLVMSSLRIANDA
ncbi:restriction endonuclease [Streptomyces sp. NPDC006458]|uniref:nSTAND3 domain-containing NTPase n=1 Tax=Streptomyces sp. NPDC006458 TaxID=3154302 RepID=UPI0033AE4E64